MRFLRLSLVSAVTALAVGGVAVGAPSQAVGCGSVITQNAKLTANLRGCTDGLILAGNGITLDLNGHTISGAGTPDSVGVDVSGQDVTVKNGTLTAFGYGLAAQPMTLSSPKPSVHVQSLKVVGNNLGVKLSGLGNDAVASSIESSQIVGNATYGVLFDRTNLTVTNSSIRGNGSHGVYQVDAVALLRTNDISQNGGNGILASDISTFSGGLFGNTLNGNGGSGYVLSQSYGDPYPHLENNRADRNAQLGFFLLGNGGSWANLDGGGNSAKGNGDTRQCVVQDAINEVPPGVLVCTRKS